jgi:agmatine deiminase
MVKWIFNAWGNKYDDLISDDRIPVELDHCLAAFVQAGICLSLIRGIPLEQCPTTEQCLLNKNQIQLGQIEIEEYLRDYLNVTKVLWLREGIVGDDTDGHIDDIARFVGNDTVLCAFEDDPRDENYPILKENHDRLIRYGLKVVKLPMPGYIGDRHARLPASYANFYIGNSAVVVPIFGHANDRRALDIIQQCFRGCRRCFGPAMVTFGHLGYRTGS